MNKQLRPGKKNRKEKSQVELSVTQAATRQGGKNRDRAKNGGRDPERGQRQTKNKQEGKAMAEPELHQGRSCQETAEQT